MNDIRKPQELPPVEATLIEGGEREAAEAGYRRRHGELTSAGRFVRFVLEGGMGAVMEVAGKDRGDGLGLESGERRFALKMVKTALLSREAIVERFRRELLSHRRLTVDLQATRLVPCLAVAAGEDLPPEQIFGLFPFYSEGSLATCLSSGLPAGDALFVVADAVEGLQSLHGHRYVHRDFHPSNILVEREGGRLRGMLGDLGVGMFWEANTIFTPERVAEDRDHRVGHPGYIDPHCRASPQADLYAVGVSVYLILTGEIPRARGVVQLPEGLAVSPSVRALGNELLERLTTPEVERRYESARDVRSAVVRLAEQLPHSATPTTLAQRLPTTAPDPVPGTQGTASARIELAEPVGTATVRRPPRQSKGLDRRFRRLVAALVLGGVLVGAGYGGWQLWGPEADLPELPIDASLAEEPAVEEPAVEEPAGQSNEDDAPSPVTESTQQAPPPTIQQQAPPPTTQQQAPPPPVIRVQTPPVSTSRDPGPVPESELRRVDVSLRDDPAAARRRLEQLWEQYPGDPEVAERLAPLLLRLERDLGPGMARRLLTKSLRQHPERGDLRLLLARVLVQLDLRSEALATLRETPRNSSHRDELEGSRKRIE